MSIMKLVDCVSRNGKSTICYKNANNLIDLDTLLSFHTFTTVIFMKLYILIVLRKGRLHVFCQQKYVPRL